MPVADPVLKRNPPPPAGGLCCGPGIRGKRIGVFRRHRDGAIVRHPVTPVVEPSLQRTLDQQGAETGTIHEEVARNLLAGLQGHGSQEPVFAILGNVHDAAFDAFDAAHLGIGAQVLGIQAGIKMKGVF